MTFTDNSPLTYTIRAAKDADLKFLPDIERSAATLFRLDPNLAPLADDEPMSMSQHLKYLQKWQATQLDLGGDTGTWVVIAHRDPQDTAPEEVVAFIVTQPLKVETSQEESVSKRYFVHIKELSVHAHHQRRGLASKLIATVRRFTKELHGRADFAGLSLTTFRDVPFNGPLYARIGFCEVPDQINIYECVGSEGLDIWNNEQAHFGNVGNGSLREKRCWMVAGL